MRTEGVTLKSSLTYADAMASACLTCPRSPCCSFLPVHSFEVKTLLDLDHAVYLANFERIELGLTIEGSWTVHYRHPCRFLDPDDRSCTVHDTPEQPHICSQYDSRTCWYRPALSEGGDGRFLRIDARRLGALVERVEFDDQRRIASVPGWPELESAFAEIPLEHDLDWDIAPERPGEVQGGDGMAWREDLRFGDAALKTPCDGCMAWCCDTLAFPLPRPVTTSGLDHLRFALGFPGVSVSVQGEEWSLLVATRCRHFANHRCGVYGQESRPLRCRNYDAWNCTYKRNLGPNPPADFARATFAEFDLLAAQFVFDSDGRAVQVPGGAELALLLRPA